MARAGPGLQARDFALTKGIIIADTKFEFGLNEANEVVLADEVLTPGTREFPVRRSPPRAWRAAHAARAWGRGAHALLLRFRSRFVPLLARGRLPDRRLPKQVRMRVYGCRGCARRLMLVQRALAGGRWTDPRHASFDKQYVRDYLLSINFDKKHGVALPSDVIANTLQKYLDVYRILTGKDAVL